MNQSVHKALKLLELFDEETKELTLKEIAERANMPKPTAYRLLTTLEAHNVVFKTKRNDHDSRYRLGLKLLELGSLVSTHMRLRETALPFMEQLAQDINEVVHLVIVNQHEATYIEKVDSTRALRLYTRIGKSLPLHVGSGPKMLLAFLPEAEQKAVLDQSNLTTIHSKQPIDRAVLKQELKHIQNQGYALSVNEQDADTTGVSYPIRDHNGTVIAALAVSGLTHHFKGERLVTIKAKTEQTAQHISRKLGFNHS
ncbi:IclR family transcriptional regulator [Lentibacillus saliphilus]|uniref:IclR family transcriptional regulator n=1 Tax=Lentibacillus saliphilus TaxID=2737028 RepID=UPI001C2F3B55|nr:IclR family transcriptional regulator [Lentibacillus saliphilus]